MHQRPLRVSVAQAEKLFRVAVIDAPDVGM
jgi:hypothetical protein